MNKQDIQQWLKKKHPNLKGSFGLVNPKCAPINEIIADCFNDLQPQWVKLGNGPEESCNVWANHMGMVRIIDFYRCPEYGNVFWSYDGEDIDDIDFTHYMVIKHYPLPPSEGE